MTLPVSGSLSAGQINVELGLPAATTFSLGSASSRTLANVPSGAISFYNFYGKSNAITGTLTYTGRPMAAKAPNGGWGNNPSDQSSWPYSVWGVGQGAGASGTTYYPYITPATSETLYYTFGCDNSGDLAYATTTNLSADPTALSYTTLATSVGFPGQNSYAAIGTFSTSTIIWFKVSYLDTGGDYGVTMAISNSTSSSGIVITTKSFDGSGNPTYTRS